ncbi:MAG: HD domain-containing protein [Deferribacteraceae bacterium]|jgi:putative hydrolase of HD superfamily|nr:HD domain-containing protein [Deferribacteraceae bacterium]
MNGLGKLLLNIRKLNNIARWSNEFVHQRASVSEHSFFVAQIAQMLGTIEEEMGGTVDWKTLYRRALNHDVPESLMGDVISTTKNMNEATKRVMEEAEAQFIDDLLAEVPAPYKGEYHELLSQGKDDTLEGQILTAADNLDALVECIQEIRLSNTDPFIEKYFLVLKKIESIPLASVQYFLKEVLPELVGKCKLR